VNGGDVYSYSFMAFNFEAQDSWRSDSYVATKVGEAGWDKTGVGAPGPT